LRSRWLSASASHAPAAAAVRAGRTAVDSPARLPGAGATAHRTRPFSRSYRQLDPALEEAAASLGAGRWRTLARVTLPQLRPGLRRPARSLAFVAALGDIVASIVLYTYETRPVSIEILSSPAAFRTGVAAAFGVVLMLVSALVLRWERDDETPLGPDGCLRLWT